MITFYPGLHQPSDAKHFARACISVNRLARRKGSVGAAAVLVDSGAFTELLLHGRYRRGVEAYAAELERLHAGGIAQIVGAVAQDYMCEPFMLGKTGLTIAEHQRLTIERYDSLLEQLARRFPVALPFPIMPVLQGFAPSDYLEHLAQYGDRLEPGAWIGIGSVCKRQGDPRSIVRVIEPIMAARPDLRLHGFGVKLTSLMHAGVRSLLWSADSLAWSYSARRQGRNANDWREAAAFESKILGATSAGFKPWQMELAV